VSGIGTLSTAHITADVSAISPPQTAGMPKRARHPLAKVVNQSSLPFPESSFLLSLNQEKPCIYNSLEVKCPHKLKAPPVVRATDEAVNPNVVQHAQATLFSIVVQPRSSVNRKDEGTMEARQARGLEITADSEITREGNIWIVPSQSSSKKYHVNLFINTCTCPDFEENRRKCKHIYAVEFALQRESGLQLPDQPKSVKVKYKQEWPAYHAAQVNEKAKFQLLLRELCKGIEEPIQEGAGRRRLPLSDIIFASAFKVYSTISCRRFSSDLRDAHEKGYLSKLPSYNSIFDYFGYEALTPYLKQLVVESSLPLKEVDWDFAVDSSGFSTGLYQKWSDAKWGNTRMVYGEKQPNEVNRKDWVKVHLMCGVKTNIVTSVEISHAHAGDSPYFKPLVETTARNFPIQSVAADKAYSSNDNLSLVLIKGGMPYIDFRSNATAKDKRSSSVWKRMLHYYQYNQESFMQHYHKRSNVETTFSMIKAKFGERIRSKTGTAQANEALLKVLCHNICVVVQSIYELGIEPAFWNED
jgi:transposase